MLFFTLVLLTMGLTLPVMGGQKNIPGAKPGRDHASPVLTNGGSGDDFNSISELYKRRKKKRRKKGRSGDDSFSQGKIVFSAGYGFPNLNKSLFSAYKSYPAYSASGFGPLHVKAEYGLTDKIGLGLSVNIVQSKSEWDVTDMFTSETLYREGFKFSSFAANARFNYHFVTNEKIDLYAGAGLGYNYSKSTYFNNDTLLGGLNIVPTIPSLIPIGIETTVGIRFYPTQNIGVFSELGYSKSLFQVGIVFKL